MNFTTLLLRAKGGDDAAVSEIAVMYKPLLIRESVIDGRFDEDLYQELSLTLVNCIQRIPV
jgi:hypothetical protein